MSASSDSFRFFDHGRVARQGFNPTAAAIVLGVSLRRAREARGITMKMAADRINASVSKLSRLERAESPPDLRDAVVLADVYRLGREDREDLAELVHRALEPEWFERYADCAPTWVHRLMAMEAEALELTTYEAKIVPGLLQTEEYAREIIRAGLKTSQLHQLDQRVELRLDRQRRFFAPDRPPRAVFLVDESVLYRRVGSRAIMCAQLTRLLDLVNAPHVHIRFLPFDSMVVSNHGSMTHLAFGPDGPPPMVYVEGDDEATYYSKTEDVERRVEVLLRLGGEAAASRSRSTEMILRASERHCG
ncbi:hypothetical protein ACZ90_28235 [Streptomyces albus subsp. albus]|nr:hypothetical protein ACZ90_28235 [Streptomyces albus subsp. albus]